MRIGGLVFAIILAAAAALIVLTMSGNQQPQVAQTTPGAQEIKTRSIVVAAKAIPAGTLITDDMLETQPWPEHLMVAGFVRADNAQVSGMIARANFEPQEPLIATKLVNRSDPNFLAGALPKGLRMITIRTNETDGLAGLVFPGDRVDVLLTHEVRETQWSRPPAARAGSALQREQIVKNLTETLLTNVRVLAVDQRSSGGVDKDGKTPIPRTVSLMVAPSDAQRLRLAEKTGELTLALRSLNDKDAIDPLTLTDFDAISQYRQTNPATANSGVMIIRGTKSEESTGAQATLDSPGQIASSGLSPFLPGGVAQGIPALQMR
jgi:pilus assembly protein CpaB